MLPPILRCFGRVPFKSLRLILSCQSHNESDDDFFKKLGINSLQALDLLTHLEHHFGIELRQRLPHPGLAHPSQAIKRPSAIARVVG